MFINPRKGLILASHFALGDEHDYIIFDRENT